MIAYVRNQDILGELYLPVKNNKIGIVWLPGLPNNPVTPDMGQPLADLGFTVLQARYPGNWQSYGSFGPSSSVSGALMGVDLLTKGRALNLNNEEMISWDINHIVLIGSSYGGGIAVSALGSSDHSVSAAIAFCPLLEPSKQNSNKSLPEDNLTTLYPYLRRCHENVYRNLNDKEWDEFLSGNHPADPSKFIAEIGHRPLLLMHGADDTVVRPYHTENFYEKLKKNGAKHSTLIVREDTGHGRTLRTSTQHIWTEWILGLFA